MQDLLLKDKIKKGYDVKESIDREREGNYKQKKNQVF